MDFAQTKVSYDSLKRSWSHHSAEIGTLLWIVAVELFQNHLSLFNELILNIFGTQDIIGCNASLSSIAELSPENSTHCTLHVNRVINVNRRFAAQLECDWCEVFGGSCVDDLADI